MATEPLVFNISIAEFDIDIGNTLTLRHPDFSFKEKEYDHQSLANLCLPDGAHLHKEDWTYLILEVDKAQLDQGKEGLFKRLGKKDKKADTENAEPDEKILLYGMGFFRNIRDETVRRGAIQKAMLILSRQPYFNIYLPLLRATMIQYMDHKDTGAVKTLFDSLNTNLSKNMQVTMWGEDFPLNIPVLKEDVFGGISLVDLVRKFREDTMLIWYAVLLQQRVLFCGQPAHEVGNCCLACPLLVAPLHGFSKDISPYVALTDIDPLLKKTYICGSTNLLFETKTEWYDVMGSFTTGNVVTQSQIKIGAAEREFIKNVLSGIEDNKGEQWVREQFRLYTEAFLRTVGSDRLKGMQRKYLDHFKDTLLYKDYLAEKKASLNAVSADHKGALEHLEILKDTERDLPMLEKTKLVYNLQKDLVNLTTIEEVCDADGVAVVARSLSESSAQVRKYAASALAQLAVSIKGQIAILSGGILSRIIEMLKDPMPNVANAASQCLQKISSLFIGVHALLDAGIVDILADILCDDNANLVMKTRAAATLLQCYRFCPNAPRFDVTALRPQLTSPDRTYTTILLQLFDAWNEEFPKIKLSDKMVQHLAALHSDDTEMRTQATSYLLSDLVSKPEMVLELVEGGGVEVLMENEKLQEPEHKLSRLSFAVLAIVADSNYGRTHLLTQGTIQRANLMLSKAQCPLYLFYLVRFLEVSCQHKSTATAFLEDGGVDPLVRHIVRYHAQALLNILCIPALGALKCLLVSVPESKPVIAQHMDDARLSELVVSGSSRADMPAHDGELQDLLAVVVRMVKEE